MNMHQDETQLFSNKPYLTLRDGTNNDKNLNQYNELITHLKIHTCEKHFKCNICKMSFRKRSDMLWHKMCHTDLNLFKCDICKITFQQKNSIIAHIKTHTDEMLFDCNIRLNKLMINNNVTRNKLNHIVGKKLYECNVCKEMFSYKSKFIVHSRIHTGEKPYKCVVCSKTFAQKGNLTTHIRTHTGEEPYKCTICNKSYAFKSGLTYHMTHDFHKSYVCRICKKSFAYKYLLNEHARINKCEKKNIKCNIWQKLLKKKQQQGYVESQNSSILRYLFKCDV